MGTLYYGDNLDILRRYLKDESVDLVYLDQPFNSITMIEVRMSEDPCDNLHTVFLSLLKHRIHVPGRIHHRALFFLQVPDQIDKISHIAHRDLPEIKA